MLASERSVPPNQIGEARVRRVACRSCGTVKQEKLAWLANNPFYTKRFAFYRAYGLRDEEYLRLTVLTCMLPPL
jgi:hypothetical protein